MNAENQNQGQNQNAPFGRIVHEINPVTFVMDAGADKGVSLDQHLSVYTSGEVIMDPDTAPELARLKLTKGIIKVIDVQEKVCLAIFKRNSVCRCLCREFPAPSGTRCVRSRIRATESWVQVLRPWRFARDAKPAWISERENMLEILMSVLGGGFGALLRFVPEIFRLFEDRRDANHEYRMMQLQIQSDKLRARQKVDLAVLQGEIQENLKEGDAYIEALRGQQIPSGIRWVDTLNASVRPMVTYWWLLLFTIYKASLIVSAIVDWVGFAEFASAIWTNSDAGILSMILGFWFVDRVMRKQHGE
uniref:Uncharacterized protein n=1 Tax=Candidatus Kentrum sp. TC TaxID=2126339 RepID=A0A451A1H7_9GAMM|nr:MAG: hypothetical protein BECKTC1821F_GA0114240_103819 [Candidatus Kentron sp. TC]